MGMQGWGLDMQVNSMDMQGSGNSLRALPSNQHDNILASVNYTVRCSA